MINNKKIEAVIFDLDGVISDTQIIHSQAESEVLRSNGIDVNPDKITEDYSGASISDFFPVLFGKHGKIMPNIEELRRQKWEIMNKLLRGNIKKVPGTIEFIHNLKKLKLPLAVASASDIDFINRIIKDFDLSNYFETIASVKEVGKGKPEPDVFLLAAKRLKIKPENCLVIEDGISGMIGAKRAGMRCVGLVRYNFSKKYPAELIVKDLREISLDKFFDL